MQLTKSPGNHGLSDMPVECITASPASDTLLIKFRVLGSVLTGLSSLLFGNGAAVFPHIKDNSLINSRFFCLKGVLKLMEKVLEGSK